MRKSVFRMVSIDFWNDTKIIEDFTVEDRYFYMYLLTNPHTNLCGCYEISLRQIERETGFNEDVVKRLLERFENYLDVCTYCKETREILIWNWCKYNWTRSEKFLVAVEREVNLIKTESYKLFIENILEAFQDQGRAINTNEFKTAADTVSIPYAYGMHTNGMHTISFSSSYSSSTDSSLKDIKQENNFIESNTVKQDTNNSKRYKYKGKNELAIVSGSYFPLDEKLDAAYVAFLEYRKAIKKPLKTQASIDLNIKKLTELATDAQGYFDADAAIKIIENTIGNGWQGLFPLDEKSKSNRKAPGTGSIDWDNV